MNRRTLENLVITGVLSAITLGGLNYLSSHTKLSFRGSDRTREASQATVLDITHDNKPDFLIDGQDTAYLSVPGGYEKVKLVRHDGHFFFEKRDSNGKPLGIYNHDGRYIAYPEDRNRPKNKAQGK